MSHKKASEEAKKNNLLAPLCPVSQKKTKQICCEEDDNEGDDDDYGVVPQKIYEEVKKKCQHYKKLYKGASLQHLNTKKKCVFFEGPYYMNISLGSMFDPCACACALYPHIMCTSQLGTLLPVYASMLLKTPFFIPDLTYFMFFHVYFTSTC